ncbi:MAG: cell division protein FtsW [Melioribacteraceae bacterium]|nr:cell division protein FtsW [Melioribacteraceae bacterium]
MKTMTRTLLIIVLTLVVLGSVLVFSASGTYSEIRFNNLYFLFKSHLWKIIGAIAALIIVSMVPYDIYKKYSKQLLIGILVILFATFIFSPKFKGAARWIDLGILRFQPSELAKLILIMHLAELLERKGELIKDFKHGFRYALFWVFVVSGLVLVQPNVSTSMIIVFTAVTLLYVGGCRFKHLVYTFGSVSAAGALVMFAFSHSRERIMTFWESLVGNSEPNTQVLQAKIGLGSGGFWGVGIGQSRQSDLFLPESYGDFIFSVLGEELGFIGAITVLFLFLALFVIGVLISKNAKDNYGKLLGFGISFNIAVSAFINAGVVMGVLPTTGITLPFISFGGTSIIIFCISVGILINIARESINQNKIYTGNIEEVAV